MIGSFEFTICILLFDLIFLIDGFFNLGTTWMYGFF